MWDHHIYIFKKEFRISYRPLLLHLSRVFRYLWFTWVFIFLSFYFYSLHFDTNICYMFLLLTFSKQGPYFCFQTFVFWGYLLIIFILHHCALPSGDQGWFQCKWAGSRKDDSLVYSSVHITHNRCNKTKHNVKEN